MPFVESWTFLATPHPISSLSRLSIRQHNSFCTSFMYRCSHHSQTKTGIEIQNRPGFRVPEPPDASEAFRRPSRTSPDVLRSIPDRFGACGVPLASQLASGSPDSIDFLQNPRLGTVQGPVGRISEISVLLLSKPKF